MSTVTIKNVDVFSASDPNTAAARVEVYGDRYRATYYFGIASTREDLFDTYDDALAAAVAHADSIDAVDVTDKMTRAEFALQLKEKDERIFELEAQVAAAAAAVTLGVVEAGKP